MRESAAPPPPTLSYTNAGAGLFVIMTTPDRKLNDLLWYAMPNLVRLAHSISDEETCTRDKARAEGVDLLLVRL